MPQVVPKAFLEHQESPLKRRRRGRPSNSSTSKIPAAMSAASLKAGTPDHKSPMMKVSPANKYLLKINEPTPVKSQAKCNRQLTPVTKKLFAAQEQSTQKSHLFFKAPQPNGSPLARKINILNSTPIGYSLKPDNSNNSFLVDPNNLLSSPVFATASKQKNLQANESLSSPIFKRNSLEVNTSFNFSSVMQSSPVYHGYYLRTPESITGNQPIGNVSAYSSGDGDILKLSVKPMVIKPEISQEIKYFDSDDDSSDEEPTVKRTKISKPLLPPVSISNLEFSSSDEDDELAVSHRRRRYASSPVRRANPDVGLAIDADGRAVLAMTSPVVPSKNNQHEILTCHDFEDRGNNMMMNSSPVINKYEEQQIMEIISNERDFLSLAIFRRTSHEGTQYLNDGGMMHNIVHPEIHTNEFMEDFAHNHNYYPSGFDSSDNYETSEDQIDPCDARAALMKVMNLT